MQKRKASGGNQWRRREHADAKKFGDVRIALISAIVSLAVTLGAQALGYLVFARPHELDIIQVELNHQEAQLSAIKGQISQAEVISEEFDGRVANCSLLLRQALPSLTLGTNRSERVSASRILSEDAASKGLFIELRGNPVLHNYIDTELGLLSIQDRALNMLVLHKQFSHADVAAYTELQLAASYAGITARALLNSMPQAKKQYDAELENRIEINRAHFSDVKRRQDIILQAVWIICIIALLLTSIKTYSFYTDWKKQSGKKLLPPSL